ncbi:hypothetical protein I6F35_12985 [Bradyrhizobium sp. BRP22]|uniref:hypothetical protein n=1 Tax=Bradyrhizobium sp. BRP22 TaxID=2793821 RepID=UPI0031FDDD92|nr:hypothetical protein [Bradyrhizobium sp. BRP22]
MALEIREKMRKHDLLDEVSSLELGRNLSVRKHEKPVRQMHHLRQIRGDDDYRLAGFGEIADQELELVARAHIDADGRLIEYVDSAVPAESLSEQNLLLIAVRPQT